MQEQVTDKTISLSMRTAHITADVLKAAMKKFLEMAKNKTLNKVCHGKQSLKQLASQNAGLSNIEITDGNIKSFAKIAKKYGVDFSLMKDKTQLDPPKYLVFFKGRDVDAITQAFKEYAYKDALKMKKPSLLQKLGKFKDIVKNITHQKSKSKDRGLDL